MISSSVANENSFFVSSGEDRTIQKNLKNNNAECKFCPLGLQKKYGIIILLIFRSLKVKADRLSEK